MLQNHHRTERFFQETRGQPLRIQGQEITLIGGVIRLAWPSGGFLIHRPLAVEVRQGDTTKRLPIHNVTQRVNTVLLGSLVISALVLGGIHKMKRSRV